MIEKEKAIHVLLKSYEAYEALVDLVPDYVPLLNDIEPDDEPIYNLHMGIFQSAHAIKSNVQDLIFEQYPDFKRDFFDHMESN